MQLTNVSDAAHTYTRRAGIRASRAYYLVSTPANWAGKGIDLTFSLRLYSFPRKSSVTVTVTVTPKNGELLRTRRAAPPLEPSIVVASLHASTDGQPDLSSLPGPLRLVRAASV